MQRAFALVAPLVLAAVSVVYPQSVTNPRTVTFIPSSDHNTVDGHNVPLVTLYELEFFEVGAGQASLALNLGKPSPGAGGMITVDFSGLLGAPPSPGRPLVARVAAVGPGGRGESAASNPFMFIEPGSPQASASIIIRITTPAYGTTMKVGGAMTISSAVSSDVLGVDFYANGQHIGTASNRPYQITWIGTVVGRYALTAVTVDRNGVQWISSPVFVNVSRVVGRSRVPPASAPVVGRAKERPGK